jgi:hypothetical protein
LHFTTLFGPLKFSKRYALEFRFVKALANFWPA